ncbi:MAG: hypothetical protein UZ15_CFX003001690 [Chloroflexi bacterium OLB15]|nr:MAG: hypothetical protein UZ15_CFX003001690 [Chloroflexi bacterium OLB15]
MIRDNRFVILLNETERQAIEMLARIEKLPASTLARRCLLLEAEQRGVYPLSKKHNTGAAKVSEAQSAAGVA